jgi:hypothetical protein
VLPEIIHTHPTPVTIRFGDLQPRSFFTLGDGGLFMKMGYRSAFVMEPSKLPAAVEAGDFLDLSNISPVIPVRVRIEVTP